MRRIADRVRVRLQDSPVEGPAVTHRWMWKTFVLFLAAWRRSSLPCSIGPVAEESTMLSSADSLDLFRLVVERAPDGIIFTDREGVIQIWNSAAAEFFGYLPEEAVGRPLVLGTRSTEHAP